MTTENTMLSGRAGPPAAAPTVRSIRRDAAAMNSPASVQEISRPA